MNTVIFPANHTIRCILTSTPNLHMKEAGSRFSRLFSERVKHATQAWCMHVEAMGCLDVFGGGLASANSGLRGEAATSARIDRKGKKTHMAGGDRPRFPQSPKTFLEMHGMAIPTIVSAGTKVGLRRREPAGLPLRYVVLGLFPGPQPEQLGMKH